MPTRQDLELARRFRELAAERHPGQVLEVLIFGSRARDEAREDSDQDLFVLTRSDDPRLRAGLQDAAWDAAAEFGFPYLVVPLVMSRERFQDLQRRERLLARDILNEGIPA